MSAARADLLPTLGIVAALIFGLVRRNRLVAAFAFTLSQCSTPRPLEQCTTQRDELCSLKRVWHSADSAFSARSRNGRREHM